MKHQFSRLAAVLGLSVLALIPARAVTLDFDMTDPTNVVGTVRSGEPASLTDEAGYVNYLLGLNANMGPVLHDGHTYQTSETNYDGLVSAADAAKMEKDLSEGVPNPAFTLSGSGWDYVLAKYDGPNGGDVVWYLGGAEFTLPGTSEGLWANPAGNGFGISHWTGFGQHTVPDGGMTAILLGLGLLGLTLAARRRMA